MSIRVTVAFLVLFVTLPVMSELKAQNQLQKFLNDYRDDRPFQYQPSDPFVRGKVFRWHTGHGGKFYNCDGQEEKRDSPYICWKVHHEYDFPPKKRWIDWMRADLAEVRQRVRDGAGQCCTNQCQCADCQSLSHIQSRSTNQFVLNEAPIARPHSIARLERETPQSVMVDYRGQRSQPSMSRSERIARQTANPQLVRSKTRRIQDIGKRTKRGSGLSSTMLANQSRRISAPHSPSSTEETAGLLSGKIFVEPSAQSGVKSTVRTADQSGWKIRR